MAVLYACVLEHTALPSGSERQEGARRSLLLLQGLWVSRDTVLIAPHPIIAAFENVLFLKPHFPSLPVAILPQCHSLCGCHHGAFLVSFSDSTCPSFQLWVHFPILTSPHRANQSAHGSSQRASSHLGVSTTGEGKQLFHNLSLTTPATAPIAVCLFVFKESALKSILFRGFHNTPWHFWRYDRERLRPDEPWGLGGIARVCGAFPLSCANSVPGGAGRSAARQQFSVCQKAVVLRDHKITFLHSALGEIIMGKCTTSWRRLGPL